MLGSCTALELARRQQSVVLVEGSSELLQGASRWNEGKIHLGYLYAADPSLSTARRLLPGGLAFRSLVERHIGRSLIEFSTSDEDICLVHKRSVVDAAAFTLYANSLAELARQLVPSAGAYLSDLSGASIHRLTAAELAAVTPSDDIVAGFRISERSVSTVAVADLLVEAVRAEPRIEVHAGTRVLGVCRRDDGRLDVATSSSTGNDLEPFDVVVNALWEGRPVVDATLGILPPAPWSHRYRAAVFGRADDSRLPSAVICTGPFGDVKRYGDGRVYASWYPACLLAEGHELEPPRTEAVLTAERRQQIETRVLATLSDFFPEIDALRENASLEVHGGWVYAIGQGSLADPASTLHRRDMFATTVDRGYISVDTAKYSIAPWLADRVARSIVEA
jgi:glycine/D-amino acid oxidase-like deaminating enzyme